MSVLSSQRPSANYLQFNKQGLLLITEKIEQKHRELWVFQEEMFLRTPLQFIPFSSPPFSSVAQLCPTLCNPMNCSMPGLPVHHHLSEFTQTHVHQDGDAIQPSHPLYSLFPPSPNLSQHQSLFQ